MTDSREPAPDTDERNGAPPPTGKDSPERTGQGTAPEVRELRRDDGPESREA